MGSCQLGEVPSVHSIGVCEVLAGETSSVHYIKFGLPCIHRVELLREKIVLPEKFEFRKKIAMAAARFEPRTSRAVVRDGNR